MTRAAALLAGAPVALLLAGPVSARPFSSPPRHVLVVDVAKGTIGGLKVKAGAAAYVRRLGIPDYIGSLESPSKVEMLWSRTADPKTGWATATLRSETSSTVTELRFAGLFRTQYGDRRGTDLSTFLRHWRVKGPVVSGVVRKGVLVEYNVVLGGVVFAFDEKRRLQAVGIAAADVERKLCVIPSACVVARIQ